jgi:hypothetical protein
LLGYFQPVEFRGPEGLKVAIAAQGAFQEPEPVPARAGLLIAPVYRLRVTNIPQRPGAEVFPTIEMIDRTYPPPGLAWKHPIPIELTLEDLYLALAGKMVTRVIYVEAPDTALPAADLPGTQRWFDSGPGSNPVFVADTLGRPVAILRLGGRAPMPGEAINPAFFGSGAPYLRVQSLEPPPQAIPQAAPEVDTPPEPPLGFPQTDRRPARPSELHGVALLPRSEHSPMLR